MKLSIIIPIYNVEDTVRRCLESVLSQKDSTMEVILIDDGSTDASRKIVESMVRDKPECHFFHQNNQGLSAARNTGLTHAVGEYITFIDSDDCIAPGTLSALLSELAAHPEYDMLEYPAIKHYGSSRQQLLNFPKQTFNTPRSYWLSGGFCHAYAWNKIYRKELFTDIRFPAGRIFEDVFTLPLLLQKAKIIATTSVGLYYYCYNPNSITAQAGGKELCDLLEAHLTHLHLWGTLTPKYYQSLVNIQMDVYEATHAMPVLPTLPYAGTVKLYLLHLIGLKHLCQLNQCIHKVMGRSRS